MSLGGRHDRKCTCKLLNGIPMYPLISEGGSHACKVFHMAKRCCYGKEGGGKVDRRKPPRTK